MNKLLLLLIIFIFSDCSYRSNLGEYLGKANAVNCGGFTIRKKESANNNNASLEFKVTSCQDFLPLENVYFKIADYQHKELTTLKTDKEGRVQFSLPAGMYSVRCSSINFNIVTTSLTTFEPGIYQIDFALGPGDPLID